METFRVIASLLLVVGLLGAALWFLKSKRPVGKSFTLLQYHAFGPKRGVAALRVYNEVLVLGITAENIRLLKSYPLEAASNGAGPGPDDKPDFSAILGGLQ